MTTSGKSAPGDRAARGDGLLKKPKPLRYCGRFARIPNAHFERRARGIGHHDLLEPSRKRRPRAAQHRSESGDSDIHNILLRC
jgi:hypothetical protein